MKARLSPGNFATLLTFITIASAFGQIQQAWINRYNGGRTIGTNQAVAIALDPDGNIIVAGSSRTNNNFDYVTIKYASNGTQLWASRYASPGAGDDRVRGMLMDKEGNIYLTL